MVRVAINGFGRIGRLVLKAAWGWPELQFVHVNEVKGGTVAAAHLLKFDSVHGQWPPDVNAENNKRFELNGHALSFSEFAIPEEVPWDGLGITHYC